MKVVLLLFLVALGCVCFADAMKVTSGFVPESFDQAERKVSAVGSETNRVLPSPQLPKVRAKKESHDYIEIKNESPLDPESEREAFLSAMKRARGHLPAVSVEEHFRLMYNATLSERRRATQQCYGGSSYSCPYTETMEEYSGVYGQPLRLIVRIYGNSQTADGGSTGGLCSGTLIGPNMVLTAAHCVFDKKTNTWNDVSKIFVAPAAHDKESPFAGNKWSVGYLADIDMPHGYSTVSQVRIPTCWSDGPTGQFNWPCDFAIMSLHRPFGNELGWMGLKSSSTYQSSMNFIGYPAVTCDGITPYYRFFSMDAVTDDLFTTYMPLTEGGDSGGGLYEIDDGSRYVRGVNSFKSYCNGDDSTWQAASMVRISSWKFDFISDALNELEDPWAPRPQLMEYYNAYTSDNVPVGLSNYLPDQGAVIRGSFSILNTGSAATGTVTITLALSTDKAYGADDILISTFTHNSINVNTYVYFEDVEIDLPNDVSGQYYVVARPSSGSTPYHTAFTEVVLGLVTIFPTDCESATTCSSCARQEACQWCDQDDTCQTAESQCSGTVIDSEAQCVACSDYSSCGSCIADYRCGWCGVDSKCSEGQDRAATCELWSWFSCSAQNEYDEQLAVCNSKSSCSSCTSTGGCGWCESTKTCSPGTSDSPQIGSCGSWFPTVDRTCPVVDPCSSFSSCASCSVESGCGWCESSSQCFSGSEAGALSATCSDWDWFAESCSGDVTSPCSSLSSCDTCTAASKCGWCGDSNSCHSGSSRPEDGTACNQWTTNDCASTVNPDENGDDSGNNDDAGNDGNGGGDGSGDIGGGSDDGGSDDGGSDDGGSSSGCFFAGSQVNVLSEGDQVIQKSLIDLKVGDRVESVDENFAQVFSEVYYIAHANSDEAVTLVELNFAEKDSRLSSIRMTHGHLLFASPSANLEEMKLVEAGSVQSGHFICLFRNGNIQIVEVLKTQSSHGPIRHPLTDNHRIVVDGVVASVHVYSDAAYRLVTAPLRVASQHAPSLLFSETGQAVMDAIVSGTDLIEEYL